MRAAFGAPYEEYCRRVNRFIPGLRGMNGGRLWTWSWRLFRQNHGFANAGGMLGSYALILAWTVLPR